MVAQRQHEEEEKQSRAKRMEARHQREEMDRLRREQAREQRRLEREAREQSRHAKTETYVCSAHMISFDLLCRPEPIEPTPPVEEKPTNGVTHTVPKNGTHKKRGRPAHEKRREEWELACEVCQRQATNPVSVLSIVN